MRVTSASTKESASRSATRGDAGRRAEGRSPRAEAGPQLTPPTSLTALQAMMQPPASLAALQTKMRPPASLAAVQRIASERSPSPSAVVAAAKRGTSTPGQSLPHREVIQGAFGQHDLTGVSAHLGRDATAASELMGADAFTFGSHVAFRSAPSLHTAAHEAAHVIQQRAGVHLQDGVGRLGDVYERHADAVADRVVRGESAEALLSTLAPSVPAPPASASAVQGAWISRQKEKSTLYRYWMHVDGDTVLRLNGWYTVKNPKGSWDDTENLESGDEEVVAKFPTEEDFLADPVVSHTTRYDRGTLTADPLSAYAQSQVEKASHDVSALKPELHEKVLLHGVELAEPTKVYRWGQYQFEKNYVVNNGFQLGNVNFGSAVYGPGLYVATTPWGSATYATEKDGAIIEVTVPAGTLSLNPDKTRAFTDGEIHQLQKNPRFPPYLVVADHSGWATIKDDKLPLKIDFYQPSPEELSKVAPHLQKIDDVKGYVALQIINRQLGSPIPMPPPEKMLAMFINQPEMKRQKVQQYIQNIRSFEFVPFMLAEGELDFTESVEEFLGSVTSTTRFGRHFDDVELTLRAWAKEPFSMDADDFYKIIVEPFQTALEAYEKERTKKKANPPPWYKGWGLAYSTGAKLAKAKQFSKRLNNFYSFLGKVDSGHSDLAAAEKDSHVGVKVGRRRAILPKSIAADERKKAITEMMMRGVKPVGYLETPTAIVMMGLPGSGKSSVITKVAPDIENYVVADPDAAKAGMPAYHVGIKAKDKSIADTVHTESREIASHILKEAQSSRRNLIYDTTGAGLLPSLFENLKDAGYHIKLVYVHVAFDTAKERAAARAKTTGRVVPDRSFTNAHQTLPSNLALFGSMADTVLIFDNMSAAPVLKWQGTGRAATRSKMADELAKLRG